MDGILMGVLFMTVEQLSRLAYNESVPDDLPDLPPQDEILYWRLHELYRKVRAGEITVDQGRAFKELQVLYYNGKAEQQKRVNEILKRYAGAKEVS